VVSEQKTIAKTIAFMAHRGQVDKAGLPYFGHPRRVADAVVAAGNTWNEATEERLIVIAYLHDVLEDTDVTEEDLAIAGIDWSSIESVKVITKRKGQSLDEYYALVKGDWYARQVKLADIADNSDLRRLAMLDDETIVRLTRKYAKAREALA
jgi:(p)ppGpp synthase/HD superfamily hydrolase